MKKTIFLLLMVFPALLSNAQILKDIGRGIKRDAEYRVEQRARDAVRKGIDSLEKKVKHKKEKKKGSEKQVAGSSNKSAVTEFSRGSEDEKPEEGEGFITLKLSTPFTVKGLTVTISGESIKYQNWNAVKLTIKSPDDEEEVKVNLNDSGKYIIVWDKLLEEGEYKITATSSDGKARVVEKLWVTDWDAEKDQEKDLMEATGTAFNRLKQKATALEPMISAKDRAALNAKTAEVKARLDALHQFLKSLKKAKNEIGKLYNSGKAPSANIRSNLVVLNQMMASKSEEVKKLKQILDHEPYDNSVCEYIAILNEACAAFSTLTNFWTNSVREVIKNISSIKPFPKQPRRRLTWPALTKFSKAMFLATK
jgi:hypothetical protein